MNAALEAARARIGTDVLCHGTPGRVVQVAWSLAVGGPIYTVVLQDGPQLRVTEAYVVPQ